jgi:hypothetical protein
MEVSAKTVDGTITATAMKVASASIHTRLPKRMCFLPRVHVHFSLRVHALLSAPPDIRLFISLSFSPLFCLFVVPGCLPLLFFIPAFGTFYT